MSVIWVCRTGKNACYVNYFINNQKICIPWEGYNTDLSILDTRSDIKELVIREKQETNRTTVSNWSGMLYSFVYEMEIGEYVLIPMYKSHQFALAEIKGNYEYSAVDTLHHSRRIEIIETDIPREIFPQSILYSLGAYRSVFRVRQGREILSVIEKWKKSK